MKKFAEYIRNQEDLRPLSAGMTMSLLLVGFVFAQFLSMESAPPETRQVVRIELKERVDPPRIAKNRSRTKPRKRQPERKQKQPEKEKSRTSHTPSKPRVQTASIAFTAGPRRPAALPSRKPATRRTTRSATAQVTGLNRNLTRSIRRTASNADLKVDLGRRRNTISGGRRGAPLAATGQAVTVGAGSRRGGVQEIGAGGATRSFSPRARRGTAAGESRMQISLPTGDGGGEQATIDIHELIKWMKANPGAIPKLVGHEMGHVSRADLASAVEFSAGGRPYTLYLSCNEKELLLRICLIQRDDFTLLKDNGISERSNFLTSGDVLRAGGRINSLISSRLAPKDRAAAFYSLFWSWWERERRKI